MALEQLANRAQTTTSGAINNSTDPVTFAVASASEFPSSGNFRVIIDDEIMLVTSVSGSNFTASRAQEGTAIASHSSGATITHVLTAGSVKQYVGEFNLYDTYANRPAAGVSGRVFTPSDWAGIRYYDTGSAWRNITPPGKLADAVSTATLPNWINQETATFTQVQGFVRLQDDGTASGEDVRFVYKATTGTTTVQVDACVFPYAQGNLDIFTFGPAFRKSSTGSIYLLGGMLRAATQNVRTANGRWSAPNTLAGITEANHTMWQFPVWFRSKFTFATNALEMWYSFNGEKYTKVVSVTDANMSSLDQVGLMVNNFNSNSGEACGMDVYELTITET